MHGNHTHRAGSWLAEQDVRRTIAIVVTDAGNFSDFIMNYGRPAWFLVGWADPSLNSHSRWLSYMTNSLSPPLVGSRNKMFAVALAKKSPIPFAVFLAAAEPPSS
jgi:hypothetical protein